MDTADRSSANWVWPAIIALAVIGLIAWAFAQGTNRIGTGNTAPAVVNPAY
jgi:hypothetical protein